MSIELVNIWKNYGANREVLQDVSLSIPDDSIYCLLGKNGAGKSTLLHIITALIDPDQGQITLNNMSYSKQALVIKKKLGILTQFNQIIGELNAYDFLAWIGLLYEMSQEDILTRQHNLLTYFFDDTENIRKPAKSFSSGMLKKLGIAAALIHKPDYLILDEPFANLDPVACDKLCELLAAYRSPSRTILISSHDLLYVNRIATHIGILDRSTMVFDGTMKQFTNNDKNNIDQELMKYLNLPGRNELLIQSII